MKKSSIWSWGWKEDMEIEVFGQENKLILVSENLKKTPKTVFQVRKWNSGPDW